MDYLSKTFKPSLAGISSSAYWQKILLVSRKLNKAVESTKYNLIVVRTEFQAPNQKIYLINNPCGHLSVNLSSLFIKQILTAWERLKDNMPLQEILWNLMWLQSPYPVEKRSELNSKISKNLTPLRHQLVFLKDSLDPKNLADSLKNISSKSALFNFPSKITKQTIKMRSDILHMAEEDKLKNLEKASEYIIIPKTYFLLIGNNINSLFENLIKIVEIYPKYLKKLFFATDGKVLGYEEHWKELELNLSDCLSNVDLTIQQLTHPEPIDFIKDFQLIGNEFTGRLHSIMKATATKPESIQSPTGGIALRIFVHDKYAERLIVLFSLLVDKISRKNRDRLRFSYPLTDRQLITLGRVFQEWLHGGHLATSENLLVSLTTNIKKQTCNYTKPNAQVSKVTW
ncbi:hypothetical protein BY996DRAFT_7023498 [Phakopsora pachyrhizi]|nr:hypothetical protein BY996DRAFT_7023498 [Phakopsora pachyrhizi]